jgi:hypothetical protein
LLSGAFVSASVPDPWRFVTDPDPKPVPLDFKYRPDSFLHWLSRCKKNLFLLATVGSFTSIFKDNKSMTQNCRNKGFPNFLLGDVRNWTWSLIRIRIRILKVEGPKTYGSGRGHWFQRNFAWDFEAL